MGSGPPYQWGCRRCHKKRPCWSAEMLAQLPMITNEAVQEVHNTPAPACASLPQDALLKGRCLNLWYSLHVYVCSLHRARRRTTCMSCNTQWLGLHQPLIKRLPPSECSYKARTNTHHRSDTHAHTWVRLAWRQAMCNAAAPVRSAFRTVGDRVSGEASGRRGASLSRSQQHPHAVAISKYQGDRGRRYVADMGAVRQLCATPRCAAGQHKLSCLKVGIKCAGGAISDLRATQVSAASLCDGDGARAPIPRPAAGQQSLHSSVQGLTSCCGSSAAAGAAYLSVLIMHSG